MTSAEPEWLATSSEHGETRFRVGRLGDDLVAEWLGTARLVASRDGSRHTLTFDPAVPEVERRKLARGSVRILLRQLAGELGLHGSAVAFGDDAIVFVGGSGHGKSTMAAALCARGATLLADDAVALAVTATGEIHVEPTEADHWLDPDARAALHLSGTVLALPKTPVAAARHDTTSRRLCAIVDLAWGGGPVLTEVVGAQALMHLLPHIVRLRIDSSPHQREELERLERLLNRVAVCVLERPRAFEDLPMSIDIALRLCLNRGSR